MECSAGKGELVKRKDRWKEGRWGEGGGVQCRVSLRNAVLVG